MKTDDSRRDIPLVGVALKVMRKHPDGFPRHRPAGDAGVPSGPGNIVTAAGPETMGKGGQWKEVGGTARSPQVALLKRISLTRDRASS
jgi:hypothetical protein